MRKKYYVLVISLMISSFACAQRMENIIAKSYNTYKAEQPVEYAYLKTDRKIYFGGENIGFSLYVLDHYLKPSPISKIAYVELISEDEEYREKYVFKVKNGISSGQIHIPLEIPTGNYQLVAYTQFMSNLVVKWSLLPDLKCRLDTVLIKKSM